MSPPGRYLDRMAARASGPLGIRPRPRTVYEPGDLPFDTVEDAPWTEPMPAHDSAPAAPAGPHVEVHQDAAGSAPVDGDRPPSLADTRGPSTGAPPRPADASTATPAIPALASAPGAVASPDRNRHVGVAGLDADRDHTPPARPVAARRDRLSALDISRAVSRQDRRDERDRATRPAVRVAAAADRQRGMRPTRPIRARPEHDPFDHTEATVIEVTIGRLDVRTSPPPAPTAPARRTTPDPPLTLSDYLQQRARPR